MNISEDDLHNSFLGMAKLYEEINKYKTKFLKAVNKNYDYYKKSEVKTLMQCIYLATHEKTEYNILDYEIEITENNILYGTNYIRLYVTIKFQDKIEAVFFISSDIKYLNFESGFIKDAMFILKYSEIVSKINQHDNYNILAKYMTIEREVIKTEYVERSSVYSRKNKKQKRCYLMIDSTTGYVKIGKSIDPEKREKTLQCEKPTIKLLHYFEGDHESELHRKYSKKRIRGEWFNINNTIINNIIKKYK